MNDEQIKRVAEVIRNEWNARERKCLPAYMKMKTKAVRDFADVAAKAAIEAMEPQWQSIDTAPKDGSEFIGLGYDKNNNQRIGDCFYSKGRGDFRGSKFHGECQPTKWVPLPKGE